MTPRRPTHQENLAAHGTPLEERARPSLDDLVARFQELSGRDALAQAVAILIERGAYDPARHVDPETCPPLTAAEWLELLTTAETIRRIVCHPAYLERAVTAGVGWDQAAAAMGVTVTDARTRHQRRAVHHPRPNTPQRDRHRPAGPEHP